MRGSNVRSPIGCSESSVDPSMGTQPPAPASREHQAAEVLRLSRNAAYALAHRWRDTGGRDGIPVIDLGRSLRVPRAQLERLLAG